MPYDIVKYKTGYRICKSDGSKCFSNNPMTLTNAKKQRIALYLAEHRKHGGMMYREMPEMYYEIKSEADKMDPIHSILKNSEIHDLYHQAISGGAKDDAFVKQLGEIGLTSTEYLHEAKLRARQAGYDPSLLSYANDGVHKLQYMTPHGLRRFGRVGYNDYIIWSYLEQEDKVPKGYAAMKRNTFHQSHERISQIHKLDKYSRNAMALAINW